MLRAAGLALVVAALPSLLGAAEATLGVRYADAMASLDQTFVMHREARDGDVVYRGSAGGAALTLRAHADLVRKAELSTEDVAKPDLETSDSYLRNFTLRGRFVTNLLPSWHTDALAWLGQSMRELAPMALEGRPQSRSIGRDGVQLRLDLAPGTTSDGRPLIHTTLTVQPETDARRR
jgi:hypothetical protein